MQEKKHVYLIDKTKDLEEGIERFSAVYIEGNAATGKTVAVKMLLEKHPEVSYSIYPWERECVDLQGFLETLQKEAERMVQQDHWLILENFPADPGEACCNLLTKLIETITNQSKVIFVSREKPKFEILRLMWQGKIELITLERLLFTKEEVREYVEAAQSNWNPQTLYEKTGGWPGCVAMLVRLKQRRGEVENQRTVPILDSYEMKCYVEKEILSALHPEERRLLSQIAACPWVDEALCTDVWDFSSVSDLLCNLYRKGMLVYEDERKRWSLNILFRNYVKADGILPGREDVWYEEHGYLQEAVQCMMRSGNREGYRSFMLRNYKTLPALGMVNSKVLDWNGKDPRACYLRGLYYYQRQRLEGLEREIATLEKIKEKTQQVREIILNLMYLNPKVTLLQWLDLLASYTKIGETYQMYQLLGGGGTYLCGIRDLSGLFVGTVKEVRQRERLWKQAFGSYEWKCYQLARMDFYLETEQKDAIDESSWNLLKTEDIREPWQLRLAKLYLICKLQREYPEEGFLEKIEGLEKSLKNESYAICRKNAEAISSLYAPWYGKKEKLIHWLRDTAHEQGGILQEENYLPSYCAAKGYLLLNQYGKAEKLIKKLIPVLQPYHRTRMLAELLFQQGIIDWKKDLKGQAVRNTIESFLLCGNSRYVAFYASYGQRGFALLDAFIEWQQANAPEGWTRKKKYSYGSVLRMPMEDYARAVLRSAKKSSKAGTGLPEEYIEEHLTMTETMVLQNIGKGLSNAQICEVLGLKLSTVKGYAYSLYRKLNVENRTQAIRKGRELGLIE